ncbi:methylenetetrahydrofolate--tRNA-(uracil(54)-C(5))-methyltransferase (FADH(2)-oxidizing) TrmFO [Candidatus Methylomirabilis sp.]|uniref:methylenetetrahydrofolate--tRNA-(uracil(54)- C(5))-methyltransferase (FADH(2)-oxidizing) TrmFO n=1 Tax=Candidatus Methylomirabilis sp. TaxID=2032687 RepID=UPI0030767CD4
MPVRSTQTGIIVVGGGLAGSEAAWQAAERGARVRLYEMRPVCPTPAHKTDRLAELVCSNSLKSDSPENCHGLLKQELTAYGSVIMLAARAHAIPAGSALAVDRDAFAAEVTARLTEHPRITIVRDEVKAIPEEKPVIIATGPLTSDRMAGALRDRFVDYLASADPSADTRDLLYFYDAISPIIAGDSIDHAVAFAASRYNKGGDDYLNCPFTQETYRRFWETIRSAELTPIHAFEEARYFERCLPIEVLAARGEDALRFGPMKPVGLIDPQTGRRPYAVVQLRLENREGTMYNMVGFQTRLKWGDQRRIFRTIPGLSDAEFLRYGSIHRNTFIAAPALLRETMQLKGDPGILLAGQLTGVEGYLESAGTGLLAGINAVKLLRGEAPVMLPTTTALGSLIHHICHANPRGFQPMNVNFGLLPPLDEPIRAKQERRQALAHRALRDLPGLT